ncbi:MAG: hypothetical protein ACI4SG_00015 [Oligosphaeraceae bacterium]
MIPQLDNLELQRIRREELPALAQWDKRGLFPAVDENGEAFARRLETLREKLGEWEEILRSKGECALDGLVLKQSQAIPARILEEAGRRTRSLYGFQCDWVPGFFQTPGMGWLFGGCTYSWPPDLFTVFIINERLREKKRTFLFSREELMAHELCHVARAGLNAQTFEEHFAYQTSKSPFRRAWGGIMHSQGDSFLFLGACLLLLLGQFLLPCCAPRLPLFLNWLPLLLATFFLAGRHCRTRTLFSKALTTLAQCCHGDLQKARILLFHATDQEIRTLAAIPHDAAPDLLAQWARAQLRWKIACFRTGLPTSGQDSL